MRWNGERVAHGDGIEWWAKRRGTGIERWAKRRGTGRSKGLDRLAAVMVLGIALRLKMAFGKRDGLRISVWMCLRVEMDDGFGMSVTGNQKGTKEDTGVWGTAGVEDTAKVVL